MTSPATLTGAMAPDYASIAQAYFDALADGELSRVPWHDDVILYAPLAAQNPLTGRRQVEAFLGPLAGNLGTIQIREIFVNRAGNAMAVEALVGPLQVIDKFVIEEGRIVEQQNFYDPRPALEMPAPGGLTSDERSLLVQKLEEGREGVRKLLANADADRVRRKPQDGGWSALECAEHLVLAEEALLEMIRGQLLGSEANPALVSELQGRDGTVIAAMQDRSRKVTTFDFLVPRGRYTSTGQSLDAFLARRADTLDFVRRTRDAVHHHAAPMEGLGLLDAYHWLLLIAAHTGRHLAQMREALA